MWYLKVNLSLLSFNILCAKSFLNHSYDCFSLRLYNFDGIKLECSFKNLWDELSIRCLEKARDDVFLCIIFFFFQSILNMQNVLMQIIFFPNLDAMAENTHTYSI